MKKETSHARKKQSATIRVLNYRSTRTVGQSLTISDYKGMHIIPFEDVLFLKAQSNYCEVHLTNGMTILCSKTLKSIEEQLPGYPFLKTHKSYIVRTDLIRFIGPCHVQLLTGKEIPVSRTRRQCLLTQFAPKSNVKESKSLQKRIEH